MNLLAADVQLRSVSASSPISLPLPAVQVLDALARIRDGCKFNKLGETRCFQDFAERPVPPCWRLLSRQAAPAWHAPRCRNRPTRSRLLYSTGRVSTSTRKYWAASSRSSVTPLNILQATTFPAFPPD